MVTHTTPSKQAIVHISAYLAGGGELAGGRVGIAPCLKHVFLKYFSIKAELLDTDITADSGSKFCIENI